MAPDIDQLEQVIEKSYIALTAAELSTPDIGRTLALNIIKSLQDTAEGLYMSASKQNIITIGLYLIQK